METCIINNYLYNYTRHDDYKNYYYYFRQHADCVLRLVRFAILLKYQAWLIYWNTVSEWDITSIRVLSSGGGGRGEAPPKKLQASPPPVYSCDCTVVVIVLTCGAPPPKQKFI